MLTPAFAGELFGPGQPLDANNYFIILPDGIGTGGSSKPSDGLRTRFPAYNYDDMVLAQYRLVTECLGIRHLRLLIGNSMGGMHAWMWAVRYPDFMDALVPMASQPTDVRPQLDAAPHAHRDGPQRPGVPGWQLPQSAPLLAHCQRVLRAGHQRRNAGLPEGGADNGVGRQLRGHPVGPALHVGCQRLLISMGCLARL
ncbi:alpha/beta fold hydrolase [Paraburkholderia fynbosensis]|uniref:alpha/beta fold hydrolase n=1 Tax=Paraburkholderia fynbosensis TaxID=1200993 RepID=UPI003CCDC0AA